MLLCRLQEKVFIEQLFNFKDKRIVYIQVYLLKHLNENITTKKLAEIIDLSVSQLIRLVKNEIGPTPRKYLFKLRVEHAKYLLKNTDISIAEIAIESGFFDQSHLNRVFKKFDKSTPYEYRKCCLN